MSGRNAPGRDGRALAGVFCGLAALFCVAVPSSSSAAAPVRPARAVSDAALGPLVGLSTGAGLSLFAVDFVFVFSGLLHFAPLGLSLGWRWAFRG